MEPITTGALITAGSSILGGLLGSDSRSKDIKRQIEAQKEFAQHGIQWRVEDAKRAGLHPLYALGASTSGPSISVGEDPMGNAVAQAGQAVGRAVSATMTPEQRAIHEAQLRVMDAAATKDFALAQAALSKSVTDVASNPAMPAAVPATWEQLNIGSNRMTVKPDEVVSPRRGDTGLTSAPFKPSFSEFHLPSKSGPPLPILLPATGGGNPPEEIEASMLPAVIGANLDRYGYRWIRNMAAYFTGQWGADAPATKYNLERQLRKLEKYLPRTVEDYEAAYGPVSPRRKPTASEVESWYR